jgi:hypothetical protein
MEDQTSLIRHSRKLSWNLELITGFPLHITLRKRSSRNIEQTNHEYPSEDSESNGLKLKEQALWAYRMVCKMLISMTPYHLVYEKTSHLPIELEHKFFWAIKKWNMDLKAAGTKIKIQIAELEEWREKAYHSAKLYKERTIRWHNK